MKTKIVGALALTLLAAACGTNREDRVTGGAAAGAATGAGVGALGGPVGALAGAAIGGGAGAVTGAVTEPSQVNLGRPLWNDPEVRVPGTSNSANAGSTARSGSTQVSSDTRQLQQALNSRGFDAGPVDGVYGQRTRQAVMDYQRANNMEATGRPSQQLMSSLNISSSSTRNMAQGTGATGSRSSRDGAYMGGGMVGESGSATTRPGSGATGTGATSVPGGAASGGSGNLSRPNPTGATGSGAIPTPSNNPMNDPIGGSGQAIRPGMNQNRDGGGQGGGSGAGGGGGNQ
jgi:peptidoglycan hydrolase-like protein with peptidoglycan-binding domain